MRHPSAVVRLLFVCMGNICRSPTAEGVMRGLVREQGLEDVVEIDSAGTGAWHVGDPPDARATAAAGARGIVLAGAARQVAPADFADYDLILAADRRNLRDLRGGRCRRTRGRGSTCCGSSTRRRPARPTSTSRIPYYGGDDGFEHVLDLVEAACRGLLDALRADGRL